MDKRLTPTKIALLYAAFSALWIFASDELLALVIRDPDLIVRIGTVKGFIFVIVTAWLLYLMVRVSVSQMIEKDKQLKLFYEFPFFGMAISSATTRILLYVNDRFCEMLGYTRDELLKTTWTALTHPDDIAANESLLDRIKSGEAESYLLEKRYLRKDGSPVTVNMNVRFTRGPDGEVDQIIALIEDITERKRAEIALQESEQRLKDAQHNAHVGYYDIDIATGKIVWSEELYNIFGLDPSTFKPTLENYKGLLHDDDIERVFKTFSECVQERKPFELSYRIVNSRGDIRHALSKANVTTDDEGNVVRMFGTLQDITDLKQAEQALRESEDRFHKIFAFAVDGILLADPETRKFVMANPAIETMLGYNDKEILELGLHDIHVAEEMPDVVVDFNKRISGESLPPNRVTLKRKDGSLFRVDINTSHVTIDGKTYLMGIFRDVTEREQAEMALRESEATYRSLFENMINGIAHARVIFKDGRPIDYEFISVNPGWERMTGLRNVVGKKISEVIPGYCEHNPESLEMFGKVARSGESARWEHYLKELDKWFTFAIYSPAGGEFVVVSDDITERKKAEDAIRQGSTVFQSSHNGIIITDLDGHIQAANQAYLKITGYSEAELLGRNPRILHSGRQDRDFYSRMWASILKAGNWQGELWNRRKNGEVYPAWLAISAVKNDQGETTHYVGISSDLSQLRQSEEEREHLAHYDPLTDLPNRLLLQSHLTHALAQARRHQSELGVLYLDLDRFKNINDSLGYQVGDELLVTLSERLTMNMRSEDILARLGGDEFLLVLEHINSPEDAALVARSLLDTLSHPFVLPGGQEIFIGASIGISVFPNDGDSAELLIQHADSAMHQAKTMGRNTYRFYTEELTRSSGERLELENKLRHAITANQLLVYYQPQVDIATGHIIGAEALVRWQDPERGLIQPVHFIPLAEETGLISDIGAWVLKETCLQGMRWIEAGLPYLTLAVNLSPHQFLRGNIAELVSKALAETRFPASRLELELTESALMTQEEAAVKMLHLLRAQDIRLAIDDFGTGYSSLAYLKRFPLDTLKIDKSFVDDIPFHKDDMEIAATIIAMAHILGFKVLAEGVETAEQLNFLKEKGCDMYQGYLASPPLPAKEFEKLLKAK